MKRISLLLLCPLAAFAAAPVSDWSPNATTFVAWQGNASNGGAIWDRVGALQLGADVLASSQYELARTDLLHASVHLAGDWYPRFDALTRGVAGLRADWQHTFGADEFAPVFTAELGGDGAYTGETARRGIAGEVTLKLSQRIGTRWRATLSERFDQYSANRAVFDNHSSETALEISRDINDATRFSLTGRWRDGDVVTYARYDRPDLVALAHDQADLNTFHQRMTAYAFTAKTLSGRAALIHATAEDTAVVLAYEYGRTSRSGTRFENSVISVSFVHQY